MNISQCFPIIFLLLLCVQISNAGVARDLSMVSKVSKVARDLSMVSKVSKVSDNHGELAYNHSIYFSAKFGTDTWNDRMKQLISGLVGLVNPEGIPVGKFISVLINFFWPSSAVDIWELVKDQVDYMVDQKILAAEIDLIRNSLNGLKHTMQQYVEAKPHEKGSLMSAIITVCNDLHSRLVNSKNAVNLIPLTVTLSYMHLTNLKERLVHGKEIYDEDNTRIWRKDLKEGIETYKKEFHTIYLKWREWRSDSISATAGEYKTFTSVPPFYFYSYTGNVNDRITGYSRNFIYHTTLTISHPDFFKEICDTVKSMVWKRANGAILRTLLPTFFLDNFTPGNECNPSNPDPEMKSSVFGPFSYNVLSGNGPDTRYVMYPSFDNPGNSVVTQINVREWNLIDGLQFNYNSTWGTFVGNSGGGQLHGIDANGRLVHNVKFSFNNQGMVDIEIIFSDGQTSGKLGNRGGWHSMPAEAGGIDSFGLKNVKMSGYSKVSQIELFYEHVTCRPSDIKQLSK